MRLLIKFFILSFIFINFYACAKKVATITIVDDKSALEKQILGQFNEFNKEIYLLASVRAIDESGQLIKREPLAPDKRKVVSAMQRMAFNSDDIKNFKKSNVLAENNKGLIEIFQKNFEKLNDKDKQLVNRLVEQENEDRNILMRRILETNINLKD
ncbi:MAG TPA: hypothetical protein PLM75_05085, partial [bacterium]|nr:hypothetical protein [bacterium]